MADESGRAVQPEQGQRANGPAPAAGAAPPALHALLASGARSPASIAALLREHPDSAHAIIEVLQRTFGNQFVQQVVCAAEQPAPAAAPTGLPAALHERLERGLGADFSDVRVHADSARADEVGARAFTEGNEVHFAPGEFQPDSDAGQELIGHEFAHVVQQREGRVAATMQAKGGALNADPHLEAEADQRGAAAVHGTQNSARVASGAGTSAAGGVIQRVEKDEVLQTVIKDEEQNQNAGSGPGLEKQRAFFRARDNNECLDLLRHVDGWPIRFAILRKSIFQKLQNPQSWAGIVSKEVEKAKGELAKLAETAKVDFDVLSRLVNLYGFVAVRRACQEPSQLSLEDRIRNRHEPIDLTKVELTSEPPKYTEVGPDKNVLESMKRVHGNKEGEKPSPNDYIHRHFTPAAMELLFAHPEIQVHVLEGTVPDLLHFARAGGYTQLNPLSDNVNTDFAKYIARDPETGNTVMLVLAAHGDAYRSEVLAHFTHYRCEKHPDVLFAPDRVHLHALPSEKTEQEFSGVIGQIGEVDAVVLGKVDDLRKELALRNVHPTNVIRSTTPPVFGLIYEVEGKRIVSLNIEPGLFASRAGAFLSALLQHSKRPQALLFAGTAGALDPQMHVGDLVVPSTIQQIDSIVPNERIPIKNRVVDGIERFTQEQDDVSDAILHDVSHGSVESCLVEDNQWLDAKRDQKVQVVEQEVASLVRAADRQSRQLAWYVFFTISDVVGGDESFAKEGSMQRREAPIKPGQLLRVGLQQLLGLQLEGPKGPLPRGALQLQLGVEQLKQTRVDLVALSEHDKRPEIAKQIEQIDQMLAIKPKILGAFSGVIALLERLHPKQAKVVNDLLLDAVVDETQPSKEGTKEDGDVIAAAMTTLVRYLQSEGIMIRSLETTTSVLQQETKEKSNS